jgi:hypothetical protein
MAFLWQNYTGSDCQHYEAERFLRAAVAFKQEEGSTGLLHCLADPKTIQAGSLRKALEYIPNENVFYNGFLPLLEILGGDDLGRPVYEKPLEAVLKNLYNLKFLLPEIVVHVQTSRVQDSDNRTALIWSLAKLALVSDEQIGSQVRSDDTVLELSKLLSGPGSECLDTILSGSLEEQHTDFSLARVREEQAQRPGGHHYNDSADFCSIKILPTINEFLCPADLPKASSEPMMTAQLLDCQFRLIREDIIGPPKEALDDKRKLQRDLFPSRSKSCA